MAGTKTIINGIQFDSKLEAAHYTYFMTHPKIKILQIQPHYELQQAFKYDDPFESKSGIKSLSNMIYSPDFFIKHEDYKYPIAVESKGFKRPDYMLRRKLFLYQYVKDKELYWIELTSLKQAMDVFK